MENFDSILQMGIAFHGHKCPAMPLGIRAGLAAMKALGVERSQDRELMVRAETGRDHVADCFLDGIMTATGCTYGKGNIEKLYYNKIAFTLIDNKRGKSVRVSLKPDFFAQSLKSPFTQQRKAGLPPQDIPAEVADPLIKRVLAIPEEAFLIIGEVREEKPSVKKGWFEAKPCEICGELVFLNKLRINADGKIACMSCSGYEK